MKRALLVIAIALLAGACAKKQQAAKSPGNQTMDSEKASGAPDAPAPAPAQTQRNEDPCTGGEQPR